jgi:IS30 family transposase
MSRKYNHLSKEERDQIAILKGQGKSVRAIAAEIGRDPSTISRELRRNRYPSPERDYLPHSAQLQAEYRWRKSHCRPRLKSRALRSYVRSKLKQGWSPEQISGRLRHEGRSETISHEAIYQWIYCQAKELIPCLARARRRRLPRRYCKKSRFRIAERVFVQDRPTYIETRQEVGHWEVDTVFSRRGTASLAVATERKTRFLKLKRLSHKSAQSFGNALIEALRRYPQRLRQSITYDNGSENTRHLWTNRVLGTCSYFCEPYHSWEKGTVENSIGLIRRYFPKGTNFLQVSDKEVARVEKQLNNRPRKCLNYKTPAEALREERCT